MAIPKNRAASAKAHRDACSTREITGRGDLPQRPSKVAHPFGRIAELGGAVGAEPRHSAHSRIPMRSHRRSASSRFCLDRRSTDQHASQSDKRAARRCSRIRLLARRLTLDMAPVAFGMCLANRFCDYYQAARSSRSVRHYGPPERALIDQPELDAPANMNRSPAAVLAE